MAMLSPIITQVDFLFLFMLFIPFFWSNEIGDLFSIAVLI